MKLVQIKNTFGIFKLTDMPDAEMLGRDFVFFARTQDEISLLCPMESKSRIQDLILVEELDYAGFYIDSVLDFSLTGILAELTGILAKADIPVFAVSTFNTDYLFIRKWKAKQAVRELIRAGWEVEDQSDL